MAKNEEVNVGRLVQHPAVELQPGQLAVEEQRFALGQIGEDFTQVADVERFEFFWSNGRRNVSLVAGHAWGPLTTE